MLAHWIWLATRRGVSARTAVELLQAFPDIESLYYARDYRPCRGLDERSLASLLDKSLEEANSILERCRETGISILTYADGAYPTRLRNISDPPMVLYYKGTLPEFDGEAAVAVVGTRKASIYGCVVAKRMGFQIAKCGGLVVSGLAGGVDAMAMHGALMADGKAVGVLGCGADVVYPRSNESLYRDTERHGCLLTEFPPGTAPLGRNFPRRNRIISGLCCGVVVVEAPIKSGALITAQCALDQGRDVFAVPGNIDSPASAGCNALLREGAVMVRHGWDVMEEYEARFPDKLHRWVGGMPLGTYPQDMIELRQDPLVSEPSAEKVVDNGTETTYHDVRKQLTDLTSDEQRIYAQLTAQMKHIDQVIADADLPADKVLAALTMLEIKGLVSRHPGKYYSLARSQTGEI